MDFIMLATNPREFSLQKNSSKIPLGIIKWYCDRHYINLDIIKVQYLI